MQSYKKNCTMTFLLFYNNFCCRDQHKVVEFNSKYKIKERLLKKQIKGDLKFNFSLFPIYTDSTNQFRKI